MVTRNAGGLSGGMRLIWLIVKATLAAAYAVPIVVTRNIVYESVMLLLRSIISGTLKTWMAGAETL